MIAARSACRTRSRKVLRSMVDSGSTDNTPPRECQHTTCRHPSAAPWSACGVQSATNTWVVTGPCSGTVLGGGGAAAGSFDLATDAVMVAEPGEGSVALDRRRTDGHLEGRP